MPWTQHTSTHMKYVPRHVLHVTIIWNIIYIYILYYMEIYTHEVIYILPLTMGCKIKRVLFQCEQSFLFLAFRHQFYFLFWKIKSSRHGVIFAWKEIMYLWFSDQVYTWHLLSTTVPYPTSLFGFIELGISAVEIV